MLDPVLTARVRSVLAPLITEPLEVQNNDKRTGVVASLTLPTADTISHKVCAEAWGLNTVRLSFTVDTATAVRLARAYGGASIAADDMEARTGTALPWRAPDALIHALPYPALADLVDGNGIFVARGLVRDHAKAIAEAINARHASGAEPSEDEHERQLSEEESRDNLRLLDWIADKIGLPKDEELSRENFSARVNVRAES